MSANSGSIGLISDLRSAESRAAEVSRGKADVHHGRALVELEAVITTAVIGSPSTSMPSLIETSSMHGAVIAPADGLVPAMIGTKRAINLAIGGKGAGPVGAEERHLIFPGGRRRGWHSGSTAAATGAGAVGAGPVSNRQASSGWLNGWCHDPRRRDPEGSQA